MASSPGTSLSLLTSRGHLPRGDDNGNDNDKNENGFSSSELFPTSRFPGEERELDEGVASGDAGGDAHVGVDGVEEVALLLEGSEKERTETEGVEPNKTSAIAAAATLGCSGVLLAVSRAFPPSARPWFTLALCIISGVAGTFCMNLADGFSNLIPSILVFILYGISLSTLTLALKDLPMSTAYSIWAGTGTALTSALGVIVFHEAMSLMKVASIGLIV